MSALAGLRVLDLSRILAGPLCTQMLSDLGAEVWKVEPPWGDDTRHWGPPFAEGEGAYYLSTNRGKQSLCIDFRNPAGQALVKQLATRADIVVENFKSGSLARYGLDYDSLAALNPRLIYASITGFGQSGPRAQEPGYDVALQAISGVMSVTGEADGPPVKVGVAWIDVLTGLTATIGILAALRERELSGQGQQLDLSLFDVGVAAMINQAQSYLLTGNVPQRMGHAHPQIVPYQAFEASDGWFVLAVGNDRQYRAMTEAIGHPELWQDARYQTNEGRVEHREALIDQLQGVFRERTREAWLERFNRTNVPATPVNTLADTLNDPQAGARNLLWNVPHPTIGNLPLLANPLQFMSRTPATPQGPPPRLGEHTDDVLSAVLSLSAAELGQLRQDKVIG